MEGLRGWGCLDLSWGVVGLLAATCNHLACLGMDNIHNFGVDIGGVGEDGLGVRVNMGEFPRVGGEDLGICAAGWVQCLLLPLTHTHTCTRHLTSSAPPFLINA